MKESLMISVLLCLLLVSVEAKEDHQITADKGLKFLVSKQRGGLFDTGNIPGESAPYNWTGQYSAAAVSGLAYLQSGSTISKGEFSKNIEGITKAFCQLKVTPFEERTDDQYNWAYGFMLMFLSQVSSTGGKSKVSNQINALVEQCEKSQCANGGWTHGGLETDSDSYSDFVAASVVVLNGMAMAEQAGYEVSRKVLNQGFNYLKSSSQGGYIGYSPRKRHLSVLNSGSHSAGYMAMLRIRGLKHPFLKEIKFDEKIVDITSEGHADGMYHYLFTALLAHQVGGELWKKFKTDHIAQVPSFQNKNGSFKMLPRTSDEKEPSDMGVVWDTAICCILLALETGDDTIFSQAKKNSSKVGIEEAKKKKLMAKNAEKIKVYEKDLARYEEKKQYKKAAALLKKMSALGYPKEEEKLASYKTSYSKDFKKYKAAYEEKDYMTAYIGLSKLNSVYGTIFGKEVQTILSEMRKNKEIAELIRQAKALSKLQSKFDKGKNLTLQELKSLYQMVKAHPDTSLAKKAKKLIDDLNTRSNSGS